MVGQNVLPDALLQQSNGVLLVVSSSEEPAKNIESHLRNAGHPLHTAWVSDLAEMEDVLRRDTPNLLLCEDNLDSAPLQSVVALSHKLRPELPILALIKVFDPGKVTGLLDLGLQDCVSSDSPDQLHRLEHIVIREIINHHRWLELKSTRERLEELRERQQQLAEATQQPVANIHEGILSSANTAFVKLLGHENADALVGTPIIDLVAPEQQNRVKERLRLILKGRHNGESMQVTLQARNVRVDTKAKLTLGTDQEERVIELVVQNTETSDRGQSGRGSRVDFAQVLSAPAPGNQLRTALLVKIDRYSDLEDRVGMIDAEEIRTQVGIAIRSHLQAQDSLFVFSSDELALVLLRSDINGIEDLADILREKISKQIYAGRGHEAEVMISAAIYPMGNNEKVDAVIQHLASEVRKLSSAGGDRIRILGDAAKSQVAERERSRVAAAVKLAMEEDRLKLAYQSIASLEGDNKVRVDVLLRMVDETGNEFHAGEFLPQAETAGLMQDIDRWVIRKALGTIGKHGQNQVLFVKLSENTIRNAETFFTWFQTLPELKTLPDNALVFGVQELAVQNHVRKAKALMHGLHKLGIGIALEHYGIGASSLQLLDHIPLQYLKFDPSFTHKFNDKKVKARLVELVEAAKRHKIKTIVVQVETADIMAGMWQMGVNLMQGFHVQEPEVVLLTGETA